MRAKNARHLGNFCTVFILPRYKSRPPRKVKKNHKIISNDSSLQKFKIYSSYKSYKSPNIFDFTILNLKKSQNVELIIIFFYEIEWSLILMLLRICMRNYSILKEKTFSDTKNGIFTFGKIWKLWDNKLRDFWRFQRV